MRGLLAVCCILVLQHSSNADTISAKTDFGEEPPVYFSEEPTFVPTSKSKSKSTTEDEDVDVKHTIVVSTKLNRNNNRKALTNNGDDGALTFTINETPKVQKKDDSEEVPVIKSYKSVETTAIRTPDTRYKTKIYPDSILVNRNIRDEADVIAYPMNWRPASFYNNINNNRDQHRDSYSLSRRKDPNQGKFHRKICDENMKDFYCKKCAELIVGQGPKSCSSGVQERSANTVNSWYETTTSKMKIDGKLAKLN